MQNELTNVEQKLLNTSDEEITKRNQVFSFDIDILNKRLEASDSGQKILQAHLYLDHCLSRLLHEALANPQALQLDRMSFSQKMQLSDAMGLLPNDLIAVVGIVNKFRNKIAHKLDYEFEESYVKQIKSSIPKSIRNILSEYVKNHKDDDELEVVLTGIVFEVDMIRQRFAAQREIAEKVNIRLKQAVQEINTKKKRNHSS